MVRLKNSEEIRKRDRFRRKYLKLKTALSQTIFKQQRNRVNNLKKQLKETFYTNINENLNELKTINSKTYWKIINTLLKGESTMNDIPPIQDPKIIIARLMKVQKRQMS